VYSTDMPVAIVKYDGTLSALRRSIELCNGFEKLREDNKILLKPNIAWGGGGSKKMPKYGFITTSRIVEDLIQLLRERGCKHLSIGEGTVVSKELGSDTLKGYKWSGLERVAKKYGVKLIDFNRESHRKLELDGTEIGISDTAVESDFLINLPVLKTHTQTKVSLGLKNLKGCLDMKSRMEFHRKGLEHLIALLNTRLKPELTIIDGIYAMERGPDFLGTAHRTNLIIAGKDNLSCDIVGSTVLGVEPSSVEHLAEFASIAKRSLDINTIDVRGENIKDVTRELKWDRDPEDIFRQAGVRGVSFQHPGKQFCSGCLVSIESSLLAFVKDNMGATLDDVEICCGSEVKPKRENCKVFLVGNCSIRANKDVERAIPVKGCPPRVADTLITLMNHTLEKRRARSILAVRAWKKMAHKLGIYDEDFPILKRYELPEFDRGHF
jgi:uncharacterized protein (DUF362 family)